MIARETNTYRQVKHDPSVFNRCQITHLPEIKVPGNNGQPQHVKHDKNKNRYPGDLFHQVNNAK